MKERNRKKKIDITEGDIEVFEVEGYNCLYGIRNPKIFLSPEIAKNLVYKKYVLMQGDNHYWIDENGILWGEGTSEYGKLGILKEDLSVVDEPVKIAENVIHVDFSGEYFAIYLTADNELYGLGASPAGILTQFGMWSMKEKIMISGFLFTPI